MEPRDEMILRFELGLPTHPTISTYEIDEHGRGREITRDTRFSVNQGRHMYFQIDRTGVRIYTELAIRRDFRVILVNYDVAAETNYTIGSFLIQAASNDIIFVLCTSTTDWSLTKDDYLDTVAIIGISSQRICGLSMRFQQQVDEWVHQELQYSSGSIRTQPPRILRIRPYRTPSIEDYRPLLDAVKWYQDQQNRILAANMTTVTGTASRARGRRPQGTVHAQVRPTTPTPFAIPSLPSTSRATPSIQPTTGRTTRSRTTEPTMLTRESLQQALQDQPSTSSGIFHAPMRRPAPSTDSDSETEYLDQPCPASAMLSPTMVEETESVISLTDSLTYISMSPAESEAITVSTTGSSDKEPIKVESEQSPLGVDFEEIPGVITVDSSSENSRMSPPAGVPSCRRRVQARNASPPAFPEPTPPKRPPKSVRRRTARELQLFRLKDHHKHYSKQDVGVFVTPIYRRDQLDELAEDVHGRCYICNDRMIDYRWPCGHLTCTECVRHEHARYNFEHNECMFCRHRVEMGFFDHPMQGNFGRYVTVEVFERRHPMVTRMSDELFRGMDTDSTSTDD